MSTSLSSHRVFLFGILRIRRPFSISVPYSQDVLHTYLKDQAPPTILCSTKTPPVSQTLTEKIIQKYSVGLPKGKFVKSGDFVTVSPHRCMTHDNSYPVSLKFMSIGATKVKDPKQIVMTLDHDVQNKSYKNL